MKEAQNPDLLYGYAEIAEFLGLTDRQVEALAEKDNSDLPVFNIGRRRCALRSRLNTWLLEQADAAARARVEGQSDAE